MSETKMQCNTCSGSVILFHSTHEKYCPECKVYFPWKLTKGQKSSLVDGLTAEALEHSQELPNEQSNITTNNK